MDQGADFPTFAEYQRVPHWEIGQALGILDMESGAKLAGSMFALYRGAGARLVRALTSFAMNHHSDAYEEIRPPTLALTETMISTGHLPKSADDMYEIQRDGLWAIPTGEVPLTSLRRGEILDEAELPVRLTAQTNCFRREAGSAGKDTRGVLRLHEFEKVELFAYCTPAQADDAHADILRRAEELLQELGLPYRRVEPVHRVILEPRPPTPSTSKCLAPEWIDGSRSHRSAGSATIKRDGPTCAIAPVTAPRPWCTRSTGRPSPGRASGPR